MMHTLFVGIDMAKAKFDAAILNSEDKYRSKIFPNTSAGYLQFLDWLAKHNALGAHLCMETTGVYGRDLANFLVQKQLLVSVVNPAQIHAFGKTELNRAKTDKADARLIARYCRMHRPAPWAPPAEEIATLQALVQRLDGGSLGGSKRWKTADWKPLQGQRGSPWRQSCNLLSNR